jgi:Icc-related predicted phosphoesterase
MAWSGDSRVLALVDLHWRGEGHPLSLPDLEGVDLVLLGGDLTHFRGIEDARRIVDEIRDAGPAVRAVCGNCDRPEIEEWLRAEGIGLDRSAETIADLRLVGLSAGLPFGDCPYERSEEEFAAALDEAWDSASGHEAPVTVLLSHQPPFGVCDAARGRPVGSRAVRAAVEEHRPDLVICGHIHEAVGRGSIGPTTVINPGPWFAGGELRFEVVEGTLRLPSA